MTHDTAIAADLLAATGAHPVETTAASFADLGLSKPVLATLTEIGFAHPTPIQSAVIPTALTGADLIGLAETGSGKTAAFALPMAEKLQHGGGLRGLILCPTREIALQTTAFLKHFGKSHQLKTVCIIGGEKMGPQLSGLKNDPDIVVATPGRLVDHMDRKTISLDKVSMLVLDEADHMLDLGFLPQVETICKRLPKERQTFMFSATMPPPIERLTSKYLNNPQRVDLRPDGRAARGITHRLYLVEPEHKKACIRALLQQELGSTLVFVRMKRDADWLCRLLETEGHPVTALHSDRSQSERVAALESFRQGEHRILVATDIMARGIDVRGIQHVINFDLPENVEDYVHRAGRTARANATGIVSSISTWQHLPMVKDIEKALGADLPRCTAPGVTPFTEVAPKPMGRRGLPVRW